MKLIKFPSTCSLEGEIVEIVMQNARALNNVTEMHPWHLHGFSFYVVGMGDGIYKEEEDVPTYNLENPIRRDTFTLFPGGWTAIRFRASNVGVWPFHCVIPPHLVMGMETLLVVSPNRLGPPPPASQSCGETSLSKDYSVKVDTDKTDTTVDKSEEKDEVSAAYGFRSAQLLLWCLNSCVVLFSLFYV